MSPSLKELKELVMGLFREKDYEGADVTGLSVVDGEVVEVDVLPIPLPGAEEITSQIKVSMVMDQVSLAVTRLSEECFGKDRGTMEYDGQEDTYIMHLKPSEEDKTAVGPLFSQALDVWMVIDAHTRDLPFVEGS